MYKKNSLNYILIIIIINLKINKINLKINKINFKINKINF